MTTSDTSADEEPPVVSFHVTLNGIKWKSNKMEK